MDNIDKNEVIKLLEDALGSDAVSGRDNPPDTVGHVGPSPFEGGAICRARPADTAGISAVISLANKKGLNLVPVSSGPPHRKGGSIPESDAVILDLSGMDRVIRVDRRNRVALLEPGVTYGRLREAASDSGLRVLSPFLPRPGKSVIGSCLDREPITAPRYHWDASDPLLCTEILFGTGELFRTGSAAGPGSLEDQWEKGSAQKNPMGPAATDLARVVQGSQGTIGIVTWASVKLEVMPEIHRFHFVQGGSIGELSGFIYEVLRKKLSDELLVLNSASLCAAACEDKSQIDELKNLQAPYTVILGVSGIKDFLPEKKVAYQEKEITAIAARNGLTLKDELPGINADVIAEILDGPCSGEYWKDRPRGACREIFFLATLDRAPDFEKIMNKKLDEYGFPREDLGIYIQPIQQGRACHIEFNLFYDPSESGENKRVIELAREACVDLAGAGAFFSRPYGPWVDLAYARCPDSVQALGAVKNIFDPNNILNRGKLCFKEAGVK